MRKFLTLLIIIVAAPAIAGLYGILHDQFTFTISPEYFTRFKFLQFHIGSAIPYRMGVAIVGWKATWWMGIPIGFILGCIGLIHYDAKVMFLITMKAFVVAIIVAFATGLTGLLYGEIFLADKPREYFQHWFIPDNLIDFRSFISVGSMHNFSYLGGLTGLIAGMIYSVIQRRKFLLLRKTPLKKEL